MTVIEANILNEVPSKIDNSRTLRMIRSGKVGHEYVYALKSLTALNDKKISNWLGINEKTFRGFRTTKINPVKDQIQEHTILALTLIKHGTEVFGTTAAFVNWLEKENFFFDKKPPIELMNTYSGIKFIDDRLTAMEYGDNV